MEEHPKRRRPSPGPYAPPTTKKAKPRLPAGGTSARSPHRKQTEAALQASEARVAADLDATMRLHAVSTRLIRQGDLGSLLEDILVAAISIAGADMGNIQMFDPFSGALKIAAHRGFQRPFLEFFHAVHDGMGASCGQAMERGERVVVEDVTQSPVFVGTEALGALLAAGVRSTTSTPLIGRSGRLLGMMSTHRRVPHRPEERVLRLMDLLARQAADAIERVQAEEALREAEAAARREAAFRKTLEDSLLVGLAAVDLSGRQIHVNDAFCRMVGWSREDLLGALPPFRYCPPEDKAAAMDDMTDLLEGEHLLQLKEVRLLRRDGERIDVLRHFSPVQEEPGRVQGYVASFINISERKAAESVLKKSEARFRTSVETMLDGFAILSAVRDEDGKIADFRYDYINEAGCRMNGRSRQDTLGRRYTELFPGIEKGEWFTEYVRTVETGEPLVRESFAYSGIFAGGETSSRSFDLRAVKMGDGLAVSWMDVTERVRTGEDLRRRAEELETVLASVPAVVWIAHDPDCRRITGNRAADEVLGLPQGAEASLTAPEGKRPTHFQVLQDGRVLAGEELPVQRAARGEVVTDFEESVVFDDGTVRHLLGNARPLFDAKGRPRGSVAAFIDITERKRAEEALRRSHEELEEKVRERTAALARLNEALRESEERYRGLIEDAEEGIWTIDEQEKTDFINRRGAEILGYAPEEMIGRSPLEFLFPEDVPAGREELGRRRLGERGISLVRMRCKSGSEVWVRYTSSPVMKGEEVVGALAMFVDVTKQHKAEAALRETTRTLEELVHASPVGITVLDPEGKITLWNPAMETISGWSEAEVRGKLPPPVAEDQEGAREALGRILTGEPLAGAEFHGTRRDGRPVDIRVWTAPAWEEGGRVKRLIAIVLDITQIKDLERMALIQEKMASLGQVAAGIAHEIRNPLSGLNIYLFALEKAHEESKGLEEEIREICRTILGMAFLASTKIEGVIRRVMDFARQSPRRMEPLSLNACVREALELARVTLRRDGIRLKVSLQEDLPPCRGDARLLDQAFLNLLTNAAQAMEGTEGEKRIEVSSAPAGFYPGIGDCVTVSVADSGPGVPLHLREKIFDPFFTTKKEGTGIGLALTHRIVSDHGGFIRVGESRLGGALFTIGLPAGSALAD
jgi:PAS domain S-box-containing protein